MLFLACPACSTCKRAEKFLRDNGIDFTARNIKEEKPGFEELKMFHEKSNLPLKKFFNTSGMVYRSLGLKDKISEMSEDEMLHLLASDGMLVKRPLLVLEDEVLVGFKEEDWRGKLGIRD